MRKLHYFLHGRLFPCVLLLVPIAAGGVLLAVFLPRLLAPVALVERVFSFVVAVIVATGHDLPESKAAKLLLLFLPWTGAVLALLFRTPREAARLQNCTPNLGHAPLVDRLFALSERMTGLPPSRAESVSYFPVGQEMFRALTADLKILKERAAAGVDVRLIYDDFGCALTLPEDYVRELAACGIRAAAFGRVRLRRGLTRRDHRKLAVIDDVAYCGGVNLADEYIGEKLRFGHWKDTALRIQGGISAFSELFLRTWYALRPSDGLPAPQTSPAGELPFALLCDGADARERIFPEALALLLSHAERRIYCFTPYLSLPASLLARLRGAAAAGLDVRVVIPHIPDKRAVFFLTRAYARLLEECGVQVREYVPGFLHAKSLVIDGKYALVSSYNLDFRSLYVQAECGAFIADMPLAEEVERDFLTVWKQSAPVKKTNAFVRGLGRIAMLFAPLT